MICYDGIVVKGMDTIPQYRYSKGTVLYGTGTVYLVNYLKAVFFHDMGITRANHKQTKEKIKLQYSDTCHSQEVRNPTYESKFIP